jgi:hypothetical protein
VEGEEQSVKMMRYQVSQHEQEEAKGLHPDLHASAGYWTSSGSVCLWGLEFSSWALQKHLCQTIE